MKNKLIGVGVVISGLIALTFLSTLLTFVYRYLWFSINTMPAERWFLAFVFTIVSIGVFAVFCGNWRNY